MSASLKPQAGRRIGFVSTRFEGTDGVSLEAAKWAEVLERLGHSCFYFAGKCERPAERSRVVPEAFFLHPEIGRIHNNVFSGDCRPAEISERVQELKTKLKRESRRFVDNFGVELLIVENALSIPLNLPLGLAITEFIAENCFQTIAHHHDFYWERDRFLVNCGWDYIRGHFPPRFPTIHHVVINSQAAEQLSLRTGISSHVVPNVMDFDHPPPPLDEFSSDVREALGVADGELFFLQPTRVVQRKGIEHAIELIDRLGLKARLVISHASGDEGNTYEKRVRAYAERLGVPASFEATIIHSARGITRDGGKVYSLADAYQRADLVTYPSTYEGFGNAFLEAVYYRRPIVVNNYSIFATDIKPRGFRVIEFDGFIGDETVRLTREVLGSKTLAQEMTEQNYQLAKRHFSYSMLERRLQTLLGECFGEG